MMLQIIIHRELGIEEGQNMLDSMGAELRNRETDQLQGGFGKLHIPGVTRRDNEFPQWFRDALQQAVTGTKFVYDKVNLYYYRDFVTEDAAEVFDRFFHTKFREAFAAEPEKLSFLDTLHIRIMDDHPELSDKKTY
jgi:hypothetical protein